MTPDSLLDALDSALPAKAGKAARAVIELRDAAALDALFREIEPIRSAVARLPEPSRPAPRDYRDTPRLALAILERHGRSACRCGVYPDARVLHAQDEARRGFVRILSEEPTAWCLAFRCRCAGCGKSWKAEYSDNYHYPVTSWRRSSEPAEADTDEA